MVLFSGLRSFGRRVVRYSLGGLAGLVLLSGVGRSQSVSVNFSGRVGGVGGVGSRVTIDQLVGDSWVFRDSVRTDVNGVFSGRLSGLTGVRGGFKRGSGVVSLGRGGVVSGVPVGVRYSVRDFNVLGEVVGGYSGVCVGGGFSLNRGFRGVSGRLFQVVDVCGGCLTRGVVVRGGRVVGERLGRSSVVVDRVERGVLGKSVVGRDSLYLRFVGGGGLFSYDTVVVGLSKSSPEDLVGVDLSVERLFKRVYARVLYSSSLGERRVGDSVGVSVPGVLDTVLVSDSDGFLVFDFLVPKDSSRCVLSFPSYSDRLNTRVLRRAGELFDDPPLAITDFHYSPRLEVLPVMRVDLDSLVASGKRSKLALFDFQRFYRTNHYINNGVFDMEDNAFRSIFYDGINMTWTDSVVDSLWIITSNKNQSYWFHDSPVDSLDIAWRDSALKSLFRMGKLKGTGLEEFSRINFAGVYYVDDVDNNSVIDYLYEKYNGYNYMTVYFSDNNGNGQIIDNDLRIVNAEVNYVDYPTWGNITSELLGGFLRCRDPPNSQFTVGDYFCAGDDSGNPRKGYNGTVFTEAAWGAFQLKFLLPQRYPLGR